MQLLMASANTPKLLTIPPQARTDTEHNICLTLANKRKLHKDRARAVSFLSTMAPPDECSIIVSPDELNDNCSAFYTRRVVCVEKLSQRW